MPIPHCPHPTSTMEHVNNCPDSKYTWDQAAERTECHRIFDNCLGLPKQDLKYHCLINPYLNETVEVCAPSRRMFGGFCPEYSTRAEGVQENFDGDCKKFQSSCPITFMSTEAYKYQECYTMINRRTTQSATEHSLKAHSERTSSTSSSDTKTNTEHSTSVLFIVLGTIVLVAVVLLFMWMLRKRKQRCKRRNAKNVKTKKEVMRRDNADYWTGNDQPQSYSYLVSNPNNSDDCERDQECYTMINRRTTQSATENSLEAYSERTSLTSSSDIKTNDEHSTCVLYIVLGTIVLVAVVLLFMLTLRYCSWKRKQRCKRRNTKNVKTKKEVMQRDNADYWTGNDQPQSYSYLVSNPNNSDDCERDISCAYTKQSSVTITRDDGVFNNGIECVFDQSNSNNASTKGKPSEG